MPVILKMEETYPNISSGIVSFENTRTNIKFSLELPRDLENGAYGIRSITMDTGASGKELPFFLTKEGQSVHFVHRRFRLTVICVDCKKEFVFKEGKLSKIEIAQS